MFQGLSLEQAPPYAIPLRFYITAGVYLTLLSILVVLFGSGIASRFEYAAIASVHTLTIGFFSHIMFGSMFQMLPVMLGIPYANVVRNANIIYALINVGVILFISGFLSETIPLMHAGGSALLFGFLYFSYLSFNTVFQSKEKDFLVQNFASSFALLFVASIFGFIALLGHSGVVDTVKFGDIHISLMLFGWVFLLLNAVSYRIIPMFFVANEFPKLLKGRLYMIVMALLFGFVLFRLGENMQALSVVKILLAVCVVVFTAFSMLILKKRKRARRDISIDLWYFSMTNLTIAALLFAVSDFVDVKLSFSIGFFALFGGIYALINAMLYKIVPFLTWFHLSSSMVFEAEMSEVIKRKKMQLQVWFYYGSYVAFAATFLFKTLLFVGAVLFFISSVLLLLNIVGGYRYYQEYIKKKITML